MANTLIILSAILFFIGYTSGLIAVMYYIVNKIPKEKSSYYTLPPIPKNENHVKLKPTYKTESQEWDLENERIRKMGVKNGINF